MVGQAWTSNSWIKSQLFASVLWLFETVFDWERRQRELDAMEKQMTEPGFWDNQERARAVTLQRKANRQILEPMAELSDGLGDIETMVEMAEEAPEFAAEIPAEVDRLGRLLESLELQALLGGPRDNCGAILSVNARDGGTDANDWAEMLLRMYTAWAQAREHTIELLDRNDNEEAGINSASIAIRGPLAYGYLKGETGMHRLVRISPFNAEGKRQTSFAAVDVSPEVEVDAEIEIDPADIREDTFRASGAGGQHVNKTSSAIRLTHLPTGVVVQCQNERSQHKNRASAWKMLRSKMARIEEEKREAELAAKYQSQAKVGFGSQIRSYFQHPDQRIKDSRTGHAETNFQRVLDGNIDEFLESYLRWRVRSSG